MPSESPTTCPRSGESPSLRRPSNTQSHSPSPSCPPPASPSLAGPQDALADTVPVGSLPDLQDFNSKYANDPVALRQLEQAVKSNEGGGQISWKNERDVDLLLDALMKVEEGTGDIVTTKGRGKNTKLVTVTCKTGDSGLPSAAQTFLAWVLREYGSEAMRHVTQQQVKNKHTDIRAIRNAVKSLDQASGDPFKYNEHTGYGHIEGDLGGELDQLMSSNADDVAGRSNLVKHAKKVKPFRHRPWPNYVEAKEIFEGIRQEGGAARGSLARTFHGRGEEEGEEGTPADDTNMHDDVARSGASDDEHSEHSVRERERKRVAQARGSGTGTRAKGNASREAAQRLSTQLASIKEVMNTATQDNSELNSKQTLKLDQFAVTRDAVGLLEDATAFGDASKDEKRFLISHLREGDNAMNFISCGRTLRDEWIEDAIREMHSGPDRTRRTDGTPL